MPASHSRDWENRNRAVNTGGYVKTLDQLFGHQTNQRLIHNLPPGLLTFVANFADINILRKAVPSHVRLIFVNPWAKKHGQCSGVMHGRVIPFRPVKGVSNIHCAHCLRNLETDARKGIARPHVEPSASTEKKTSHSPVNCLSRRAQQSL